MDDFELDIHLTNKINLINWINRERFRNTIIYRKITILKYKKNSYNKLYNFQKLFYNSLYGKIGMK